MLSATTHRNISRIIPYGVIWLVWELAWTFFLNATFLSVVLYIAAIVVVVQFYAEVSNNNSLVYDRVAQSPLRETAWNKYPQTGISEIPIIG